MSIPPATSLPNSPGWSRLIERLRAATAGRFTIVRELGRGGFAAVFLAQQHQPSRPVAIKLLLPAHLDSEWALEHFRGESQKIANWRHQSVVTIYEVHEIEDLFFFVMSYVEGGSLHDLIGSMGPLSVPITRSVLAQMGSALQYAHRQGVTHRDIKPQNVLIDTDGGAVVTDFGISKQSGGTSHTVTGMIFGTAPYMAPEQCESGTTSKQSDQYAIGIVAYEMLMGAPPFTGTATAVLMAHLQKPVPPLRVKRPDVPVELEAAVMRMLEKDPANRFPTVADAMQAAGVAELSEQHPERAAFALAARRISAEARTSQLEIVSIPPVLEVGDKIRVNATARTATGELLADADIKWRVADSGLAHVDSETGTLSAMLPGVTSLFVQSGRLTQEIQIEIRPPRASAIALTGVSGALRIGDVAQLVARTTSKHGIAVSATPRWTTTDPSIAQVSNTGAIRALRMGRACVSAIVDDVSAELWVDVASTRVAEVRVTGTSNSIDVGDSRQLRAVVLDSLDHPLEDRGIAWSSSDRNVATVSSTGLLSATGTGNVTISASCEGVMASIALTVRAPSVASVEVLAPSTQVKVGDRVRLTARVRDTNGSLIERTVRWLSDDNALATVDTNGTFAAVAPGSVIVSATVDDVSAATMIDIAARTVVTPVITAEPQIVARVEDYPSLANTGFIQRAPTPTASATIPPVTAASPGFPRAIPSATDPAAESAPQLVAPAPGMFARRGVLIGAGVAIAASIAAVIAMQSGSGAGTDSSSANTQTPTAVSPNAAQLENRAPSAAAFHDSQSNVRPPVTPGGDTRTASAVDTKTNAPSTSAVDDKPTLQLVLPNATLTTEERVAFSTRVMRAGRRVDGARAIVTSRDERTATIENGSLIARSAGQTWVVARAGDLLDSVLVTVNNAAPARAAMASLHFTPLTRLERNETRIIAVQAMSRIGSPMPSAGVAVTSSDPSVVEAVMASDGIRVTARNAGRATITVRAGDVTSDPFVITVAAGTEYGATGTPKPVANNSETRTSAYSNPPAGGPPAHNASALSVDAAATIAANWLTTAGKNLPNTLAQGGYYNDLRRKLSALSWPVAKRVAVSTVDGNIAHAEVWWEGRMFTGARAGAHAKLKLVIDGGQVTSAELTGPPDNARP